MGQVLDTLYYVLDTLYHRMSCRFLVMVYHLLAGFLHMFCHLDTHFLRGTLCRLASLCLLLAFLHHLVTHSQTLTAYFLPLKMPDLKTFHHLLKTPKLFVIRHRQ